MLLHITIAGMHMFKKYIEECGIMNLFRKISLVYVLQVFAVILIFSYTGSSTVIHAKERVRDSSLYVRPYKDVKVTGIRNELWNMTRGKNK